MDLVGPHSHRIAKGVAPALIPGTGYRSLPHRAAEPHRSHQVCVSSLVVRSASPGEP